MVSTTTAPFSMFQSKTAREDALTFFASLWDLAWPSLWQSSPSSPTTDPNTLKKSSQPTLKATPAATNTPDTILFTLQNPLTWVKDTVPEVAPLHHQNPYSVNNQVASPANLAPLFSTMKINLSKTSTECSVFPKMRETEKPSWSKWSHTTEICTTTQSTLDQLA